MQMKLTVTDSIFKLPVYKLQSQEDGH